jgi:hypothetical protein
MTDRMPMFPTAQPPRADEDTAAIEQVIEQLPGEIEFDKIIKAQTSAPQIVKRMVELENSIWSLVGILLLVAGWLTLSHHRGGGLSFAGAALFALFLFCKGCGFRLNSANPPPARRALGLRDANHTRKAVPRLLASSKGSEPSTCRRSRSYIVSTARKRALPSATRS